MIPETASHKDTPFSEREVYHAVVAALGEIHGDYGVGSVMQSLKSIEFVDT